MNAKPPKPRTVRDEDHARELLSAWRASGVPLAVFCRDRGLSYSSVYRWRRLLDAKVPALLEVKVVQAPSAATYEVVVGGGRAVRVTQDFDDDTLARLLAVLERAC